MPDEFDRKREVVKSLLSMLSSHTNKEMSDHLAPKGVEDVSVTKGVVPSSPDEMVHDPASLTDANDPHGVTAEMMADGGMVQNEEAVSNLPGDIVDGEAESEERQDDANEDLMDDDQENNQSMFSAFLPRRKK